MAVRCGPMLSPDGLLTSVLRNRARNDKIAFIPYIGHDSRGSAVGPVGPSPIDVSHTPLLNPESRLDDSPKRNQKPMGMLTERSHLVNLSPGSSVELDTIGSTRRTDELPILKNRAV